MMQSLFDQSFPVNMTINIFICSRSVNGVKWCEIHTVNLSFKLMLLNISFNYIKFFVQFFTCITNSMPIQIRRIGRLKQDFNRRILMSVCKNSISYGNGALWEVWRRSSSLISIKLKIPNNIYQLFH